MTRPSSLAELRRLLLLSALLASLCLFPGSVRGQTTADRITRPIEQNVRTRWAGSRHPLARPEFDAGRVAADAPMQRIVLVLQPDGHVRRGLAVFAIENGGPTIVDAAPTTVAAPGI